MTREEERSCNKCGGDGVVYINNNSGYNGYICDCVAGKQWHLVNNKPFIRSKPHDKT